jgi:hypothetical protein
MPAAISITRLDYTAAELRREAKRTQVKRLLRGH